MLFRLSLVLVTSLVAPTHGAVVGNVAEPRANLLCPVVTQLGNRLAQQGPATTYCSSYLSIPTASPVTTWSTATITTTLSVPCPYRTGDSG